MNEQIQSNDTEYIEFLIAPIPPDTVATVKAEILSVTQQILEEKDQTRLWNEGEIQVKVEKTLPLGEELISIGVLLLTGMALETFKALVLPEWKKHFEVKEKKSAKGKKGKK